jgi:anti-sigma B factor antagonist
MGLASQTVAAGGEPCTLSGDVETHFQVETRDEGQVRVLKLSGELDVASSADLERSVREVSDYDRLVVDLSDLEFIDSTGLSVLVAAHHQAVAAGHEFCVVQGPPQVQRLLALTGLEQRLTVAETLEQLLNSG